MQVRNPVIADRPAERRRRWQFALRGLLAIAATAGLIWYLDPVKILERIGTIDLWSFALASAIIAAQYFLAALRWHYVLRRHAVDVPLPQSLAIFGAGAVGNIVALTAVAGISLRGALLLRQRVSASRVFGVLLIERASAASGFGVCILAGFAALLFLHAGFGPPHFTAFAGLAALAGVACAALAAWGLWRREMVRRFVAEIRNSFLSPGVIAALTGLSCIIIWLGFSAVAVLAYGMDLDVNPAFFFTIMPVVALLSSLPVSIGGWGVREGAMVAGLMVFGVDAPDGAALSLTYGALGAVIVALLGGGSATLIRAAPDMPEAVEE